MKNCTNLGLLTDSLPPWLKHIKLYFLRVTNKDHVSCPPHSFKAFLSRRSSEFFQIPGMRLYIICRSPKFFQAPRTLDRERARNFSKTQSLYINQSPEFRYAPKPTHKAGVGIFLGPKDILPNMTSPGKTVCTHQISKLRVRK